MEIKKLSGLLKKVFTSILVFTLTFAVISAVIDIYYFNRVAHKEPGSIGQIAYSDFRVFWRASRNMYQHVREGDKLETKYSPVYDKSQEFYHFRYSPVAALFMVPFGATRLPATGLIYWSILLNALFFASLIFFTGKLNRDFKLAPAERHIILWGAFFMMLRFYLTNIALGQTDILTVFLFVLFLISYAAERETLCGLIFAIILQFKLLFLPMLIYFLFKGKRKLVFSAVVSFAALLLVPALFVGWDKNITLLKEWNDILGFSIPSQILNYKNQSITYAVCRALLKWPILKTSLEPEYLFYITGALFMITSYAGIWLLLKNAKNRRETAAKYLEISLLIIVSLLFSPIVWVAYFINLVIPVGVALLFTLKNRQQNIVYFLWAGFWLLSCAMGTDLTKFIPVINNLHFINIAFGVILLVLGLIYAFLTVPPDLKDAA